MKYRQIAHRLRVQMGRGNPDWVSERPRSKQTGKYKDLDEQGRSTTIVEPPDGAHIELLLRAGALQTVETEDDASGENGSAPDADLG